MKDNHPIPWLIIMPGGLGDTISAYPVLQRLFLAQPDRSVHVACIESLIETFSDLKGIGEVRDINQVWPQDCHYEWVVDLASTKQSAACYQDVNYDHLLFRPCGQTDYFMLGDRMIKHDTFKKNLPGRSGNPDEPAWMMEAPLVAALLGENCWNWLDSGLYPLLEFRTEHSLYSMQNPKSYVLLLPCGTCRAKRWPLSTWLDLAQIIDIEWGIPVIAALGNVERNDLDIFRSICIEILFSPPLRKLAAIAAQARLVVANDCGPMHLAAASGAPTVGIFGPTNPRCWFPYPESTSRHVQRLGKETEYDPFGVLIDSEKEWPYWPSATEVWSRSQELI